MYSKPVNHSVALAFVAVAGLSVISGAHGWGWAFAAAVFSALTLELA